MTASFSRHSEQHRKDAFVRATMACLAEYGYHGTSVRKIAAAAGVTPGLLTHYYAGKAELIADAYRYGADLMRQHAVQAADAAGTDPAGRFRAFVQASFAGPDIGADVFRVWLNFWTVTITEPLVRRAHAETYGDYRAALTRLISDIIKQDGRAVGLPDTEALAIGTNAIIDGLWLERGLDPETFDTDEAAQIVFHFTGAALGVDLTDEFATINDRITK